MSRLQQLLAGSPYQQYLYGYPHKTAYRRLEQPRPLGQVWSGEDKAALFLYVHVPFCEMRCGFCNLFTAAGPTADGVTRYLDTLEREVRAVKAALGPAGFARAAVGGGTPSFLEPRQLHRVFDLMGDVLGAPLGKIPISVELSPETTTAEKVRVLRERGADRVSIGIQSFLDAEVAAVKRPQQRADVERALDLLRAEPFGTLNLDFIYGIEGQTIGSFLQSLQRSQRWRPEELYLYPLYVRPLTYLGKAARAWDDLRLSLYRAGRDWLKSNGYRQISMRMFRRVDAPFAAAPVYRCQEDGMVGVGVGARSYTRGLHYSSEFAVGSRAVRGMIDSYCERPAESFTAAHHGFALSAAEQQRRCAILSLLSEEGLSRATFLARFGVPADQALPQLAELIAHGLGREEGGVLRLTEAGLERSDVIGPWLHSDAVDAAMRQWEEQ
ncbi:MAG: coproporphyrinogen oxidase family protein [Myxococcaceae bacterium]|nr:coproporphyrinogen oxidase family protein [Myxococcaceae bacterium]